MTLLQVRTMRGSLCFRSSLSRFAQASAVALIALVLAGAARADTIKDFFIEDGTARNISISGGSLGSCAHFSVCSFSGALTIDVTSGTVKAVHITFPGFSAFNNVFLSGALFNSDWRIGVHNSMPDQLVLIFTTTPTPGSLAGFEGGTITGSSVSNITGQIGFYSIIAGNITPVPEPSSLALLGAGLLPVIGVIRRRYLNR